MKRPLLLLPLACLTACIPPVRTVDGASSPAISPAWLVVARHSFDSIATNRYSREMLGLHFAGRGGLAIGDDVELKDAVRISEMLFYAPGRETMQLDLVPSGTAPCRSGAYVDVGSYQLTAAYPDAPGSRRVLRAGRYSLEWRRTPQGDLAWSLSLDTPRGNDWGRETECVVLHESWPVPAIVLTTSLGTTPDASRSLRRGMGEEGYAVPPAGAESLMPYESGAVGSPPDRRAMPIAFGVRFEGRHQVGVSADAILAHAAFTQRVSNRLTHEAVAQTIRPGEELDVAMTCRRGLLRAAAGMGLRRVEWTREVVTLPPAGPADGETVELLRATRVAALGLARLEAVAPVFRQAQLYAGMAGRIGPRVRPPGPAGAQSRLDLGGLSIYAGMAVGR